MEKKGGEDRFTGLICRVLHARVLFQSRRVSPSDEEHIHLPKPFRYTCTHDVNHYPEQTWNTMSASRDTMNAVFKLAKPEVQNAEGMFPLPYPAAADVVHS